MQISENFSVPTKATSGRPAYSSYTKSSPQ